MKSNVYKMVINQTEQQPYETIDEITCQVATEHLHKKSRTQEEFDQFMNGIDRASQGKLLRRFYLLAVCTGRAIERRAQQQQLDTLREEMESIKQSCYDLLAEYDRQEGE